MRARQTKLFHSNTITNKWVPSELGVPVQCTTTYDAGRYFSRQNENKKKRRFAARCFAKCTHFICSQWNLFFFSFSFFFSTFAQNQYVQKSMRTNKSMRSQLAHILTLAWTSSSNFKCKNVKCRTIRFQGSICYTLDITYVLLLLLLLCLFTRFLFLLYRCRERVSERVCEAFNWRS